MKPGKTGIPRIIDAAKYSLAGLKFAWKNEAAFRQETTLLILLFPLALWLGDNAIEYILLIGSCLLVLIVELLNTAVEAVVDRVGHEHHELAGSAKDLGSAAVLITLILTLLTWGWILYETLPPATA